MTEKDKIRFISNGEWFDKETEAILICCTGAGISVDGDRSLSGLFKGFRNGFLDEEVCCFTEFDLVDEDYLNNKCIKRVLE